MKGSRCPAKMFCELATAAHYRGPHSDPVNRLEMKCKRQVYTAALPLHHRVLTKTPSNFIEQLNFILLTNILSSCAQILFTLLSAVCLKSWKESLLWGY